MNSFNLHKRTNIDLARKLTLVFFIFSVFFHSTFSYCADHRLMIICERVLGIYQNIPKEDLAILLKDVESSLVDHKKGNTTELWKTNGQVWTTDDGMNFRYFKKAMLVHHTKGEIPSSVVYFGMALNSKGEELFPVVIKDYSSSVSERNKGKWSEMRVVYESTVTEFLISETNIEVANVVASDPKRGFIVKRYVPGFSLQPLKKVNISDTSKSKLASALNLEKTRARIITQIIPFRDWLLKKYPDSLDALENSEDFDLTIAKLDSNRLSNWIFHPEKSSLNPVGWVLVDP